MKKQKNRKVYYVCFYADKTNSDKIISYPSVWSKIDYVSSVIIDSGCDLEIVSIAPSTAGHYNGYKKRDKDGRIIKYFSSTFFKLKLFNKISLLYHWLKILIYLLINVKNDDVLLVYHSIFNLKWLKIYYQIFRKKFCLEIEDVFSKLNIESTRFEKHEWELFSKASLCICVNDIIAGNLSNKIHKIISYGSYSLPNCYHTKAKHHKLVYAGVIERERKAAFLAVQSMKYLPTNYELYILGFGSKEDVASLENEIKITQEHNCNIFLLEPMSGEEYYKLLQKCDIGLSTHMYNENNMGSADYTFPSKVLVYLANGLNVVAQRLKCLEKSSINDLITYYDNPNPKDVANAIISCKCEIDKRDRIKKMDDDFHKEIYNWLNK